jgi:acyl-CoA synthetase (AMP-forming)/AMP-acid ligase II
MLDDARSVWELIERRAAATPDRVMLHAGERSVTFAQYRDDVERAAAGWHARGVGTGVHVSWQLPTWIESAVLVGALCRLGAVQNPMLPIYRHREISFITRQLGTRFLVTPSTWNNYDYAALAALVASEQGGRPEPVVADARNPEGDPAGLPPAPPVYDARADDPVRWIFYTSGTTSDPKGAQHTDRSVMQGAIGYCKKTHIVEDDIAIVAFPFTHVGGAIIGVFTPLLTGSAAVLMEAFTPKLATELIARHHVTLGNGAPAIHQLLIAEAKNAPEAYGTVRGFPGGGSPKPPMQHDEIREVVPSAVSGITSGYGLTEAPILTQTDIDAADASKAVGEGTPTESVTIKLIDRDGNEVAGGDEGEIVARGNQLMRGYTDASLDAEAFTADGYFRTGDIGRFLDDGTIVITGRIKDIIIRKGENVSAKEVEDCLYTHPNVADVAVFGIPDAERGELVVAALQLKDASVRPTVADVFEHCRAAGLMAQKAPERLMFVGAMPRNPSGKVPKHELRKQLLNQDDDHGGDDGRSA